MCDSAASTDNKFGTIRYPSPKCKEHAVLCICMVLSRAKRVCMCQYAWSLRHDDTQYTGIGDCICCDCGWMRTITQPFHPDCENNCLVAWFASKRGLFNHTRSVMMVLVSAPPYMCSLPTKLYSAGFCCWGRQSAARYICTSCLAHIETSCLPVSLSHTPGLRLWSWRAICHAKSHTHAHKDSTRIQRAFVWRCERVSCLVQTSAYGVYFFRHWTPVIV